MRLSLTYAPGAVQCITLKLSWRGPKCIFRKVLSNVCAAFILLILTLFSATGNQTSFFSLRIISKLKKISERCETSRKRKIYFW